MLDVHRGRMSWRRLRVILQSLPPQSLTMTALRNACPDEELEEQADTGRPEEAPWSQLEQLVATVADAVRRVEYVLICANTDKAGSRPSPPEPIRRPGAGRRSASQITDEGAEVLFNLINGGAA